jgi:Tol biopolymer transport system component
VRVAALALLVITVPPLAAGRAQESVGNAAPIGVFDNGADVGSPRIRGSAAYNPISQDYALSAAGTNMWAQRDEFQFVSRRLSGDFILQTRVAFAGKGVDPHRKAGLIIRAGTDADAPYVDAVVHGDGLTSLQFRRTKGAATEEKRSGITGADVLQLERRGSRFIMSAAKFGDPYTTTELADVTLPDELTAGLALCSHNPDVVERAVFSNVRVIRPAAENFRPYRDYIGSRLELLDVASGSRRVIMESQDPFEAPNWTRDGGSLIYNTSGGGQTRGRLVRYDLATGHTATIETATVVRNNNDHVLSFDGRMLAISDSSAGGGSAGYTVPIDGGTPKRITPLTPSYMHGWSPDGKTIVYTAGRGTGTPEFDIFAIASDGSGTERNLTNNKGLDDGPEYSPDGKFIYFNSVRSGSMQIWRMQPDGSSPEQITSDEWHNWFPHISPDGQWIAFISFPKEVDAADHPYYKQVMLRVMPAAGGAPRTVAYVYGGQGTINVPSWSPDSRMLAFVSNSGPLK